MRHIELSVQALISRRTGKTGEFGHAMATVCSRSTFENDGGFDPMLSRRRLISAEAAAGAASLISPALAITATGGQDESVQTEGVTGYIAIKTPSDLDFVSVLNDHFPGLLNDPIFQKIQSHAVLITNISGKAIRAYSTHWAIDTPTGGYETLLKHYFHPSTSHPRTVHFGLKGNKTRLTGRIAALKAGGNSTGYTLFQLVGELLQDTPHAQLEDDLIGKSVTAVPCE